MSVTDPDALPLDLSQLVPGLCVWLDMKWMDHPFLTNRFVIKSEQDLAVLRSLPLQGRLYYLPARSVVSPPPLGVPDPDALAEPPPPVCENALAAERQRLVEARREKIRGVKDAAARADRAWDSAARATREALAMLARSPRMAGKQLALLSRETAATISQGPDALLHLLGPKDDQGPQFHALNVMTLCMLVGKKVGLSQYELTDLAMAAVAHDAGKAEIPLPILRNGHRKKHEEDHYRLHVRHSVQLARESGAFGPNALALIEQHHEAADGSGFPRGLTTLSPSAAILIMVNRYDRLCSPESPELVPLMPSEALAHMLRQEGSRHDPRLLTKLIHLLGVYPPGTVVRLSDGTLALVVSPGADIYRPRVLLYSPGVADDDAPMLDLGNEAGLDVIDAIRPTDLDPSVLQWLNPQKRLACFFSVEGMA
jgi:HD-GYP domain-containing protein (c-di-GMP phosphodiesterase class II)